MARVAGRYSMNANLIFKWLRDPRFAPVREGDAAPVFLPVEISREAAVDAPAAAGPGCASAGGLRIVLAGGHRIVAESGFDAQALGRFLKAWLS